MQMCDEEIVRDHQLLQRHFSAGSNPRELIELRLMITHCQSTDGSRPEPG